MATTFEDARVIAELQRPDILISELRLSSRFIFEVFDDLAQFVSPERWAIATVYPSIATAVKLVRMGVAAYFAKPVSAATILAEFRPDDASDVRAAGVADPWPSLDRTIWEYLSQVYVTAGTISEAARRLGLDRRSLRRMLAKYPPKR